MKLSSEMIRICRINIGMTQGQLARSAGLSGGFVGHIERDDRTLTDEVERSIRKALPLTDDEIINITRAHKNLQRNGE